MGIDKENRQFLLDISLTAKMLDYISKIQKHNNVLVFGCGTDSLPIFIRRFCPDTKVTAYDIDAAKIAKSKQQAASLGIDELLIHTYERPAVQFEVVLASHVLHHGPVELATEALSFVMPDGLIGIIDYDMKGYSKKDFLVRWGRIKDERTELEKIGHDESFRIHTSFSLDDCYKLMQTAGVMPLNYQGNLAGISGRNLPTIHFYYVGRKHQIR